MRLSTIVSLLAVPAALAKPRPNTSIVFETSTVGPWFENLAIRPSGTILATRMDAPQLWQIDPRAKTGAPLIEVPGVLSTTGIAEVATDVYVFAAGNFSFETRGFVEGSLGVWRVDLSRSDDAVPELVARFPHAGFLNGVAAWDDTRVLVSDTTGNAVYILDMNTGYFEVALEIVLPNGIRTRDSTIYLVSGESGSLFRIPVDTDARPSGEAELIAPDLSLDDFDIADDGTVYAAAVWENQIVRVEQDGEVTVLAGGPELLSCTSARLGRTAGDKGAVYVTTMGNGAFPEPGQLSTAAKIVAVEL